MRSFAFAVAMLAACSQPYSSPLTVRMEEGVITVRNVSDHDLIIAEDISDGGDGEFLPLSVGLEVFDDDAGTWRWYGDYCRHHAMAWSGVVLPQGAKAVSQELPEPESSGRFRYVIAFQHAGEEWQWLPLEEFEAVLAFDREPTWQRSGYGSWPDGSPVELSVREVRPKTNDKHGRFLIDVDIKNGSSQPISYNVTTNYWWCEEAGRWFRHPGWTICGNSAHPEIAVGSTKRISMMGKGWGRLRYGMRFDGLDDEFAARSEPFEVPYYPATGARDLR